MTNTVATPPEICPNHEGFGKWVEQPVFGFYDCQYEVGPSGRLCRWPVNKWTPDSDSYAQSEIYVGMWKQAWNND